MKLLCVWLLFTFCVSAPTSANLLRTKRDLVRIQNFLSWLLGSNERKVEAAVPMDISENRFEDEKRYIIPSYQNIYIRTATLPEVNLEPQLYAEIQQKYPRFLPVESIRYIDRYSNDPIVFKNDAPLTIRESVLGDYYKETRTYPDARRLPLCKDLVAHLYYDTTNTQKACVYGNSGAMITTTRQRLPRPPLYIQNRIRDIILGRGIPPVLTENIEGDNLYQNEFVMPSQKIQNVETYKYPLQANLPYEDVNIKELLPQNYYKRAEKVKSIVSQDVRMNQFQIKSNLGNSESQKKVQFTRPVHSSYSYKMVNHNEPHKNIVVKMETTHDVGVPYEKSTELPSVSTARISRINPPLRTEESPSNDERIPISKQSKVMSDLSLPYKNGAHDVTEVRATSRRAHKTVRENDRGDIPELSL